MGEAIRVGSPRRLFKKVCLGVFSLLELLAVKVLGLHHFSEQQNA